MWCNKATTHNLQLELQMLHSCLLSLNSLLHLHLFIHHLLQFHLKLCLVLVKLFLHLCLDYTTLLWIQHSFSLLQQFEKLFGFSSKPCSLLSPALSSPTTFPRLDRGIPNTSYIISLSSSPSLETLSPLFSSSYNGSSP